MSARITAPSDRSTKTRQTRATRPNRRVANPRAFISYSHDSEQHEQYVLEFAARLCTDGIDVYLDRYELAPAEGWPLWMERQIGDADFVLLICTPIYLRRVEKKEVQGTGLGVCWEANIIYDHLYADGSQNHRFVPVITASANYNCIPRPLRTFEWHDLSRKDEYESLYHQLIGVPVVNKPPLGKLRKPPSRATSCPPQRTRKTS